MVEKCSVSRGDGLTHKKKRRRERSSRKKNQRIVVVVAVLEEQNVSLYETVFHSSVRYYYISEVV